MARRLVLNGLTAEVRGEGALARGSPPEQEFYHELELYHQLLALPEAETDDKSDDKVEDEPETVEVTEKSSPVEIEKEREASPAPVTPPPADEKTTSPVKAAPAPRTAPRARLRRATTPHYTRHAMYLGSFPVCGGETAARADTVSRQLQLMKENGRAQPVLVVVALSGVKICRPHDQSVRMAHALRRISYAWCEGARALFAFVARHAAADHHYCHAFATHTPHQAEDLNALVGDAFRMAFASQLQPSAPLWTKELSSGGSDRGGMGVRAPDSLPGLNHHYPHCIDRSPSQCELGSRISEVSPSSSEESASPVSMNCYRRLGDRPPLIKRLAMGLSGALLQSEDDDSTPLVADTPTTPTNLPMCLNGGYINEAASEAEARTRESNRDSPAHRNSLHHHNHHTLSDKNNDFNKHSLKNCGSSASCSRATSSSSGASSCDASSRSGNNNVPAPPAPQLARHEPELSQAPWFQAGIPREIALEVLLNQPVGAFMVRCSTTQAGCFALSVRVPRDFQPGGIAHYLILRTPKGYKIKGFTKEFSTLTALVTHHSVMPELLPCPLWLARYNPAYARHDHADLDRISDPDYSARQDFNTFMCELDV